MGFWSVVWMVVFLGGFVGFSVISYRVITRGFGEARSLLHLQRGTPPKDESTEQKGEQPR